MSQKTTDVVVIGGGIAGSSIAYRLAEKGCSVTLLEKGRVGEEASGRCGGGVRQQDREPAEIPLAMEAVKIWADFKDELDCDVGYRRGGNINIAFVEERLEVLKARAEREAALGLESEMISPEETRRLVPKQSDKMEIFGAKHCPSDGTANPLLTVKAICRAARRKGVRIVEHSPVTGFKTQGDRVTAAVAAGEEYGGDVFVNAAGPWARGLCKTLGLDIPISLQKESIIVTEPLPPMVRQFVQTEKFYFRQALEGNFHLAGEVTFRQVDDFDKSVDLNSITQIGRWIPQFLPFLKNVNIIRAFTGIIHSTPDKMPVFDKTPGWDNLYLTAGFSGHGFCLGPIVGRLISEWIVDGRSSLDLTRFNWGRFVQ